MGNIIKIYITSMKFALFAVFVIGAKAMVGDACSEDADCENDGVEQCNASSECENIPADDSGDDAADDAVKVDADTGMNCSMDCYVGLVQKLMTVALSGLSILKQIGSAFLPDDLRTAMGYAFRGLTGMGDWIGYALAAAYFAAEEFNYGEIFCKVMGYLNIVLGYLVTAGEMVDNLRAMLMPEESAEEEAAEE